MSLLTGLLDRVQRHHKAQKMPAWVRRRMYRELLWLMDEEQKARDLLALAVEPRLSVVDEERVAMIRPADRDALGLDEEMRRAREEAQEEDRGGA